MDKNVVCRKIMVENNKYEKAYSKEGFWEKITNFAKKMGAAPVENALKLYYAMEMGKATIPQIAAIVGALGYFISPIDIVSDFLPGGLLDDAGVLLAATTTLACCADPEVVKAAKKKVGEWFDKSDIYFKKLFWGKTMSLGVLGKEESGKTSFLNFLRDGDPGTPDQTPQEDPIEGFDVVDSENNVMSIAAMKDINGQNEYVAKYYKDFVESKNVILFMFNANKFYWNEDYRQDVVDRVAMLSVYSEMKEKECPKVYLIPTFKDEAETNQVTDNKLKELILESLYKDYRAKKFSESEYLFKMYQTNDVDSLTQLRDNIFASYTK